MVHGAARSSSGPDRRRAAGVGAPNKRVGPALLESGAGKARQSVVSGRRGGGSGGGGGSCRSRGRGGKEGRMRCAPGPIGHPSPGGRSGRIGKTDTMRVAGRGRTGGSGGAIGQKKKRGKGRRWSSNPSGKCSYERPTRGTVCGTMRSMCGADAGCLAINYQSLVGVRAHSRSIGPS